MMTDNEIDRESDSKRERERKREWVEYFSTPIGTYVL